MFSGVIGSELWRQKRKNREALSASLIKDTAAVSAEHDRAGIFAGGRPLFAEISENNLLAGINVSLNARRKNLNVWRGWRAIDTISNE